MLTYFIGMPISWVYSRALYPENTVGLAAAIIITIPVFTIFGSFIIAFYFKMQIVTGGAACCSICVIMISSVFDFLGVILLVVSMVQASQLKNPAGPIVCGSFAAFFILLSAISNCATCISGVESEGNENM